MTVSDGPLNRPHVTVVDPGLEERSRSVSVEKLSLVEECLPLQNADTKPEFQTESRSSERRMTLIERLKSDVTLRQNLLHTLLLCMSFVGYGWDMSLLGPALPELQLLTGEDLSTQSWIFTLGSIGYLSGSVFGGILYDRVSKTLMLSTASGLMSLSLLILPFCRAFPVMLLVKVFIGLSEGLIDTGCNAHIVHIWGSKAGPYMQAMHFMFSVGALVSPLVTAPFLAEKTSVCLGNNSSFVTNTSDSELTYNVFNDSSISTSAVGYNLTNVTDELGLNCIETYEDIRVHFAFIIASIVCFIPTAGFAILTCFGISNEKSSRTSGDKRANSSKTVNRKYKFPKKVTVLLIMLVLIHSSLHCVIDDSFGRFFMTFFLGRLQWTKAKSSIAVFVFWLNYGIGNFVAIFLVSCCDRKVFLRTFVSMFAVCYLLFFFSGWYLVEALVWVSVGTMGFFMSVIFPGLMTWTSDNVSKMTGKMSGLFMFGACVAGFPFPPLLGAAIDKLGPMWYVYILGIVLVVCMVLFIAAQVLHGVAEDKWRLPSGDDEEEEVEIDVRVRTAENSL